MFVPDETPRLQLDPDSTGFSRGSILLMIETILSGEGGAVTRRFTTDWII